MEETYTVRYAVEYTATVTVPKTTTDQELHDLVADIDIPEGGAHNSRYLADSFSLVSLHGPHGNRIL